MANLSLHHLIESIAGAVADAQDKLHRFQISTIRQYFDSDNRPVSVDVRLPSLSPDAPEGEERMVRVPLLSLTDPRLLGIKDLEISFDVGLNGPEEIAEVQPADGDAPADAQGAVRRHKILNVDLAASRNRDAGATARVTLKVESQQPSEGMARLIQHLDKTI